MCGIIGYVGFRQAGSVVLQGLKSLEYRGYDSCGVCSINDVLHVRKGVGKIDSVQASEHLSELPGTIAIGHSRWATHGGVTKENAHPHVDCREEIALVHNGIIENYQELKAGLAQRGHVFRSQTDSEILAHLIEEETGALEERVRSAVNKLEGSFALLALSANDGDKLVAVRKESPLAVGLSAGEFFVASDVMPFLSYTKQAVFLEDYEMAVLTLGGVSFVNARTGERVEKKARTIEWNAEQASKSGFDYYMLKEILEQPAVLTAAASRDAAQLNAFVDLVKNAKTIKFVACGTSRHAALVGRYLFNQIAGKLGEVYIASEFPYFADNVDEHTLILCVSQSGETADVLVGLRKAKEHGAKIASLVNVVGSSIDRESHASLYLNCGPEIAVASTKAFTAQVAAFYLVASALADNLTQGVEELRQTAQQLRDFLPAWQEQAKMLAEELKLKENAYYIARGVNFPIALEGALKLKEISYIHAEGMPAGELKHGTIALIEQGTPVVLLNPPDYTFSESLSNGLETKARGAFLIGVGTKENSAYDILIKLPVLTQTLLYPLVETIPLQLLAYYTAVARGLDPDKPRNLAKAVTVR